MSAEPLEEPPERPPRDRDGGRRAEEVAFFYRTRHGDLLAFLAWYGASGADAADCAQEALVHACEHWSEITHPYAWCRRVAGRAYVRRREERECLAVSSGLEFVPVPEARDRLDEFESRHHLLLMMERHLTPAQREVIAWCYDGVSPAETAEELGLRPETVRSRLRDARRILRDVWEHDEEGHR